MKTVDASAGNSELVILSAADDSALCGEIDRLLAFANRIPDARLVDIAYTCSLKTGPSALAVVAGSVAELRARLATARARIASPSVARIRDKSGTYYSRTHLTGPGKGKLAFVYSGAISFYPDMLRDLAIRHSVCRSAFDELEEALAGIVDFSPSNFIFPPASYYRHDADIFSSGAYSQAFVATHAACAALTRLLAEVGVEPDGVLGVGGGDFAALMKAGTTRLDRNRPARIKALHEIYRLVSKAVDHGGLPKTAMEMVILRHAGDADAIVSRFSPADVTLAIDFSPRMKIFSVRPACAEAVSALFSSTGARVLRLELDRPFNTPACAGLASSVKGFTETLVRSGAKCEIYSCATAGRLPDNLKILRQEAAERWSKPILLSETVRRMYADGYRVFLEVGPRGLLTTGIASTLEGEPHAALALNSIHRTGIQQVNHTLGQLAALGARVDISKLLAERGGRALDFDAALSMEVRHESEMRLSRVFPRLMLSEAAPTLASFMAEPKGRGAKAAARVAVCAAREGLQLQFLSGATDPLISDAPPTEFTPGLSYIFEKTFRLQDAPFIGDFAYGASQLSYSNPNLRGLVHLPLPVAIEIMAETALRILPNRHLSAIVDFACARQLAFADGELHLSVRAERVSAEDPSVAAVRVQLRGNDPDAAFTRSAMEATVMLSKAAPPLSTAHVRELVRPRSVHWSSRDIYPSKLGLGRRLRGITFADAWGEDGINYRVEVPSSAGCVTFTRLPVWAVNPLLLETVASGFKLWRSHEKFPGAFSFPFRMRRMELHGRLPGEGAELNCYLRLSGVTPRSHLSDIVATSGDGNAVLTIEGWEELTERVPQEYCSVVLQPATCFISSTVPNGFLGDPQTDVSSAIITEVPYSVFERNDDLWLNIMSHVVLSEPERAELADMKGSVSRRTEWLFGRIAVKEAVRRYLKDYHQARWSYADVQIWRDELGKPRAIGAWRDNLAAHLDVAIAHTSQFVIALAAASARVGVDVESTERNLSEEFAQGVFTPEEIELAAKSVNAAQAVIRFWCAKEAVSKALGTGIRFSPKEMRITGYQPDSGRVAIRLEGGWLGTFKDFRGRPIDVTTRTMRDHALAFCFIPSSLFNED